MGPERAQRLAAAWPSRGWSFQSCLKNRPAMFVCYHSRKEQKVFNPEIPNKTQNKSRNHCWHPNHKKIQGSITVWHCPFNKAQRILTAILCRSLPVACAFGWEWTCPDKNKLEFRTTSSSEARITRARVKFCPPQAMGKFLMILPMDQASQNCFSYTSNI